MWRPLLKQRGLSVCHVTWMVLPPAPGSDWLEIGFLEIVGNIFTSLLPISGYHALHGMPSAVSFVLVKRGPCSVLGALKKWFALGFTTSKVGPLQ